MNQQAPNPGEGYPPSRWIAMAVLLLASFMNLVDVTIVNVALPSMQRNLGATPAQIEWVVAAYTLSFALALLPFGRLGDTFGRRRMFIAGVICFTLASLMCGIAPTMETLILARAVQGLAGAMMAPQTLAIAQVIFPPAERGAAFALFGLTASLASVAGPITGGLLIGADFWGLDWRPIFLVNIPVGIFAVFMALRFIPDLPGHRGAGVDGTGIVLAAITLFLLVFPLIEGRGLGWPVWIFVMLACSLPAAIAFVRWQYRQAGLDRPQLLPASLLSNRDFVLGSLISTAFFSGIPGYFLATAMFLQAGYGLTPLQSGLTTLPFSLGVMAASIASGRLGVSLQRQRIFAGSIMMAVSMVWLQFVAASQGAEIARLSFTLPFLLGGFGMGTAIGPMFQIALTSVYGRDAGSASGSLQALQQAGGAFGVAIIGQIFFSTVEAGLAAGPADPLAPWRNAVVTGMTYMVVVFVLVAASVFLLKARPRPDGQGGMPAPVPVE